jgi:2-polyprenyl-6-hydroxyphenyl methylase/3-demethylubiquinone-9 3-methyltransferase
MDFHYDVVDWVGGYPYQYGTIDEISRFVEALGFEVQRRIPAKVPTGCNEFVFRRCHTVAGHGEEALPE